jgi:hypothetical protein
MSRRARLGAALCVVALLGAGACSGEEPAAKPPKSPVPGKAAPVPTLEAADGGALNSQLERVFENLESLGGGSGALGPSFGNTHPGLPDGVLSVTFAFVCSGGATVKLAFTVGGKDVPAAAGSQVCDGSIEQRSVEVPGPGAFGFSAELAGSGAGGFAYGYYAEKSQLP